GYKIKKIMNTFTQDLGIPLNITGLYRHLDGLEKRGVLYSQWDSRGKGPARRKYYLTESGKECLRYWMRTLSMQSLLIGRFFEQAKKIFPSIQMPSIRFESRTKSSDKQHPSKVSISKSNTNQRQEVAR
ncbi:MAG: helix-turn-helix transcriptional regulator, partial [Desulfobacterales bacterium]